MLEKENAVTELDSNDEKFTDLKTVSASVEPQDNAEKEEDRQQFGSTLEFFFSTLGYAVGVGNVWRFPYLAYKNGGGVFLIPYFIMMCIMGFPMVYLEFIVGQFTSSGPLTAWNMVRISKGIGLSMNIANTIYVIYYNLIIAYALYFLAMSFNTVLPWEKCDPIKGSPNCVDRYEADYFRFNKCLNTTSNFKCAEKVSENFGRCFNISLLTNTLNTDTFSCSDFSPNQTIEYWKSTFPSQDYWQKTILQQSTGIDDTGSLVWQLVLTLFITYFLVYIILIKGVAVFGKLVYFIATFPYVVLLILGIKGWTLPGADVGIKFYVIPKWEKLLEIQVWNDAATQIFFTLAISYGGMSTFASYNRFNSNILRDALIIPVANCVTSFFAGLVIFAYMGYLAHITQQDIENVVTAGQGLAFVVYPYAVTTLAGAPIWAILFFFMMFLLGLDSTLGSVEVTIRSILDFFPSLKEKRVLTITAIFLFYYVCGLLFCFQSGTYWLEFFNRYAGDWSILVTALFEVITIAYFYGLENLKKDIRAMLGSWAVDTWTWYIWKILWSFVSPLVMILLIVISISSLKLLTLGDYVFPYWTLIAGQFMTASVMLGWLSWATYCVIDALISRKSLWALIEPDFDRHVPMKEENKKKVAKIRKRHLTSVTSTRETYLLDNMTLQSEFSSTKF